MKTMWFRQLGPDGERKFREAARSDYEPFTEIKGIWHPVYQEECVRINIEKATFVPDEERKET